MRNKYVINRHPLGNLGNVSVDKTPHNTTNQNCGINIELLITNLKHFFLIVFKTSVKFVMQIFETFITRANLFSLPQNKFKSKRF